MFRYLRFGSLPSMHHTAHYSSDSSLLNEYCFTREGFEDCYSILYLHNPPTQEEGVGPFNDASWSSFCKRESPTLQRRHFQTSRFDPGKGFLAGRLLLAFNEYLNYGLCHPQVTDSFFFANNDGDELFFLLEGEVELQSLFGKISLVSGDYLIIPRSCPYRFNFHGSPRLLFVEAKEGVGIPPEYINSKGQFTMDAPYSERSFKVPEWDSELFESDDPVKIVRKRQNKFTTTSYSKNYFKLSGWDGFVYPIAINLDNIQPKTGRVHLPPFIAFDFLGGRFRCYEFFT